MLVLSRKAGEEIIIGDNVKVVVNRIAGNRVTIGIEAPDRVPIVRGELAAITREFDEAAESANLRSPLAPSDYGLDDAPMAQFRAAR